MSYPPTVAVAGASAFAPCTASGAEPCGGRRRPETLSLALPAVLARPAPIGLEAHGPSRVMLVRTLFVTPQGSAYSQFKRALDRRNFLLA